MAYRTLNINLTYGKWISLFCLHKAAFHMVDLHLRPKAEIFWKIREHNAGQSQVKQTCNQQINKGCCTHQLSKICNMSSEHLLYICVLRILKLKMYKGTFDGSNSIAIHRFLLLLETRTGDTSHLMRTDVYLWSCYSHEFRLNF